MFFLVACAGIMFWFFPFFFTGDQLQTAVNAAVFGVSIAVMTTWGSAAYYALRGDITAEHQHIVATVAIWFIVCVQRVYSMTFMMLDRPYWMLSSAIPAFVAYMFGLTGICLVIAPYYLKNVDKTGYKKQIARGGFFGVFAAAASYLVQLLAT